MIRVLIVDDDDIYCWALSALVGSEPDTAVVAGLANSGIEAVRRASELVPDVVIMDVAMSPMDGLEAARIIKEKLPTVGILFVSGSGEYEQASVEAGGDGWLGKPFERAELFSQLRRISDMYL